MFQYVFILHTIVWWISECKHSNYWLMPDVVPFVLLRIRFITILVVWAVVCCSSSWANRAGSSWVRSQAELELYLSRITRRAELTRYLHELDRAGRAQLARYISTPSPSSIHVATQCFFRNRSPLLIIFIIEIWKEIQVCSSAISRNKKVKEENHEDYIRVASHDNIKSGKFRLALRVASVNSFLKWSWQPCKFSWMPLKIKSLRTIQMAQHMRVMTSM